VAVNRGSPAKHKGIAATATLIAQVPVVIVDVSRCGCLIESTKPLEAGTVGTLQLTLDGRDYVEDFRVARCTAVSGRGSSFRIGVEFLRTRRETDVSLRHAVTQLVAIRPAPTVAPSGPVAVESKHSKGEDSEYSTNDRAALS
jgi:hypothetical protein